MLGGEVNVSSLTGAVRLKIPPGTGGSTVFRIPSQGLPNAKSGMRGDLFLTARIRIPKDLSPEERSLVERLKALRE
jgi:DnaJ-class molecular chaperone